ncbi:MAG: hypothetical protein RI973_716 [Bacteroidota bacterium]
MQFTLQSQLPDSDSLLVPVVQNSGTDAVHELISQMTGIPADLVKADFKATLKEVQTLYYSRENQSRRIFLLGLGEKPRNSDIINAFRSFVHKRKTNLPQEIAVSFMHGTAPEQLAAWVECAANGLLLGCYDIGRYKTNNNKEGVPKLLLETVHLALPEEQLAPARQSLDKGVATAQTQLRIFDLVNAPANKKTPQTLADWALESGKEFGYSVQVLQKQALEQQGFHALLAVGRGSETDPVFIVLEYKPEQPPLRKIGLVGKGVTFDTGGISIKPSSNMHYMKSDMGGAAAVLGIVELAARLKLPFHLVGAIPATENSVDAKSIRPGDVIGSYNGKTIEVIDTDAEGRLILADGLSYVVRNFQPEVLIDLATLTGSCIRALGTYASGLFANNDDLANALLQAGEATGERLWRLPLWDEYRKELNSDVADIKNFSGSPAAGAITAAKFLEDFIEKHANWAHLDIAGMAMADSEFSSQKSATGYGIRLLAEFLEKLARQS